MVAILISTTFRGAALIRGEALISMWIPRGPKFIRGNTVFAINTPGISYYLKSLSNYSADFYQILNIINSKLQVLGLKKMLHIVLNAAFSNKKVVLFRL